MEFLIIGAIGLIILLIVIAVAASRSGDPDDFTIEPPQRAVGRRGERAAERLIRSALREDDALFTNVSVSYENRRAELDDVIVNKFGVFVIEVKNYSGRLSGSEDEYEWTKIHISEGGNAYCKTVKNPIRQVKREVYILAKYLDYYGVSVWVDGYAMILGADSPVKSEYILSNVSDIDRAIHTPGKQRLSAAVIDSVEKLLT
ncbi:MAG: NERD domain-containing protein [Clostridia bacterium]|nr:NERD domain-containing protein [Clostridia bacterium]